MRGMGLLLIMLGMLLLLLSSCAHQKQPIAPPVAVPSVEPKRIHVSAKPFSTFDILQLRSAKRLLDKARHNSRWIKGYGDPGT